MLEKFARYPLTFGPTPIEKLHRLSAHLGGAVDIFAKRDDCATAPCAIWANHQILQLRGRRAMMPAWRPVRATRVTLNGRLPSR